MHRIVLFLITSALLSAGTTDLSGTWKFFPDYPGRGEVAGWFKPDINEERWDTVEVPHIWNLEPRYEHTGAAWYRRRFTAPPVAATQHARLHFGSVFYKCKVWLNGALIGEHEGGYTEFDMDARGLKPEAENLLVIMADNSWSVDTIPGARRGDSPGDLTYPWWNYGGIKKPIHLVVTPAAYILNQKIEATPDLTGVNVRVWVRNTSSVPLEQAVKLRIRRPGAWDLAGAGSATVRIPAASTASADIAVKLAAPVVLWDFDRPNLYESLADLGADQHLARFGMRRVEVRNARLLLNGEPVSFGGANRVADHPRYGSMEHGPVIGQDMPLMKAANMGLSRILHYPPSRTLLDWCDEHGFLIVAEAGNWGLRPADLDAERVRAVWKSQAKELIEQAWNHPSVIAWSVGNEYQTDTPSGVRWTRDMSAFVRALDNSRLITFASLGQKVFSAVKPEENSFHYVDILSPNIYGNGSLAKAMETLHATWPDKPVLITEFGWREDSAASEEARAQEFRDAMAILRKYPFVIGASVWTLNDYRSRHFGTNSDGLRHWGLVTWDRRPRGAYEVVREEFSPVVLAKVSLDRKSQGFAAQYAVQVRLESRDNFPSRTVRDHDIVVTLLEKSGAVRKTAVQRIPIMKPGEKVDLAIPLPLFDVSASERVKVELRQPTGFVSLERTLPVRAGID